MIYLDNAATSWPKAPGVAQAMARAVDLPVGNAGRSAHQAAMEASAILYDCRQAIQRVIPPTDPKQTIFTRNGTEAINIALLGTLEPGDKVITTPVEHNAVARPLAYLQSRGVQVDYCACDGFGRVDLADVARRLQSKRYRLGIFTGASNVTGAVNPVPDLIAACMHNGIPFVIDAAQTVGELWYPPLPEGAEGAICFSVHKGLLGPAGVGVLALYGSFSPQPLWYGGTGSRSDSEVQPEFTPDRYESGTPAIPAIAASGVAISHVADHATELTASRKHAGDLLHAGLSQIDGLRMLSPQQERVGAVSVTVRKGTISELSQQLFNRDIAVRSGYHCAPLAHRFLGTEAQGGAIRFSAGHATTDEEIASVLQAVEEVCRGR